MVWGRSRSQPVAGRADELKLLTEAVDQAANGVPRALLLRGRHCGKTRLAHAVCEQAAAAGADVLWAPCVRFGAVESTYLPWTMAFEDWCAASPEAERRRVTGTVPALTALLDQTAQVPTAGGNLVRLVRLLKACVATISARRLVVVVLDDAQWADPASRDALRATCSLD